MCCLGFYCFSSKEQASFNFMAAVMIHSDFEAQGNKVRPCFIVSPTIYHEVTSQILKDDAVKVLHSICQQIWKTQQWPQDWKRSVFILIPKKGNAKECSNYCTIALISHASKVVLKSFQARLQEYVNHELPDVQAGFRKGRGIRDQIANIHWTMEKTREF